MRALLLPKSSLLKELEGEKLSVHTGDSNQAYYDHLIGAIVQLALENTPAIQMDFI